MLFAKGKIRAWWIKMRRCIERECKKTPVPYSICYMYKSSTCRVAIERPAGQLDCHIVHSAGYFELASADIRKYMKIQFKRYHKIKVINTNKQFKHYHKIKFIRGQYNNDFYCKDRTVLSFIMMIPIPMKRHVASPSGWALCIVPDELRHFFIRPEYMETGHDYTFEIADMSLLVCVGHFD